MKKNIIMVCVVLTLIILVFSIGYTIELNGEKIKIDGTTYAITIDGVESDSIPLDGNYYLDSYSCVNDSIITWDSIEHDLYIEQIKSSSEACLLNFNSGLPGKLYLSKMKVGDYVAYVGNNGCLTGAAGTTGDSDAEAGNSCLGENANQSADTSNYTYGYCYDSKYKFFVYGWRIAYIEEDKVHLISAGSPECRTRTESDANATQIADLNLASLKYCNSTYADGGNCPTDNSNTWAFNDNDFQRMTGSTLDTCDESSSKACGFNNNLIDNGSYFWFAANIVSSYGVYWDTRYRYIHQSFSSTNAYGFRPIIKLSPSVYVTGGSGTMDDPYTIGID